MSRNGGATGSDISGDTWRFCGGVSVTLGGSEDAAVPPRDDREAQSQVGEVLGEEMVFIAGPVAFDNAGNMQGKDDFRRKRSRRSRISRGRWKRRRRFQRGDHVTQEPAREYGGGSAENCAARVLGGDRSRSRGEVGELPANERRDTVAA